MLQVAPLDEEQIWQVLWETAQVDSALDGPVMKHALLA